MLINADAFEFSSVPQTCGAATRGQLYVVCTSLQWLWYSGAKLAISVFKKINSSTRKNLKQIVLACWNHCFYFFQNVFWICGATDTPVLDFWCTFAEAYMINVPWDSSLELHLWKCIIPPKQPVAFPTCVLQQT